LIDDCSQKIYWKFRNEGTGLLNEQLDTYMDEMTRWQQTMEHNLRKDDGWLSVVGLEWLQAGINTIGSVSDNDIILPAYTPAKLGFIDFSNEQVKISIETDAEVTIDDKPVKSAVLRDDNDPDGASVVKIDSITFSVIKRSNQYGIRVRDSKNAAIANFKGRNWFPIDSAYKVPANFVLHPTPRTLQVMNSVGIMVPMQNPGYLEFVLDGEQLRLEAFEADETQWWVIFKDGTSGLSTYGAGRFLYVQRPAEGQIWIDFNRAYHPPCAFTHYATCPLPPKENILSRQINAGERF
jgi:uncharacterized protein (DUF1684 family)